MVVVGVDADGLTVVAGTCAFEAEAFRIVPGGLAPRPDVSSEMKSART